MEISYHIVSIFFGILSINPLSKSLLWSAFEGSISLSFGSPTVFLNMVRSAVGFVLRLDFVNVFIQFACQIVICFHDFQYFPTFSKKYSVIARSFSGGMLDVFEVFFDLGARALVGTSVWELFLGPSQASLCVRKNRVLRILSVF